jgi:flagellin-like protein
LKIGKFRVSKKAVSPVIATLLMIAVAVAASVIVYVWSAGLLGTLMGGGGAQVKEQVIMEAYDWVATGTLKIYVRNVGSSAVKIVAVYVGGSLNTMAVDLPVKAATSISPNTLGTVSSGTAYTIKVVTETGGVFSFSCICGSSG